MHQHEKEQEEFNDLIFRELIKRGYALEGNTRIWNIADSKLWYLKPEQAQAFLDLEESEDYQRDVIQKEIDLTNENIGVITDQILSNKINIIDLGCGNGKKAALFIEKLKGKIKIRYCPIDISSYMVEQAMNRIKHIDAGEVVQFQWNISDFENIENISSLLRQGDYKRNFFLLLGNTLGNFEINELLYEIRSSMKDGDFLLIGNGLDNRNSEDILRAYDNKFLDNLLIKTLTQIGLRKEDLKYGTRFVNSRVEMYYTILKEKEIRFLDKKVTFNKGDQIIIGVSYKYNQLDFINFLEMYFDEVKPFVSKDGSYALALCIK